MQSQSCEESFEKLAWKVGPFGVQEGKYFDDGVHSAVKQLVIHLGRFFECIQIKYEDKGISNWSELHGRKMTYNVHTIKLDYPDEFLISIHGYYIEKTWLTAAVIDSLTFKSNKKTYGPYGTERGKHFSIEVPGSKIVGFHGWTDNYTTAPRAMGVHLKPIDHHQNDKCHPSKPLYHIDLHNQHSAGVYSSSQISFNSKMSCEKSNGKMPRKVGPFGAQEGGIIFDDGVHSAVKQLVISYHHSYINFIHIKYDDNGSSNWSNTHGYQMPEHKKDTIKLDYPDEFLTSVYGCYSNFWPLPTYISSLTFKSNKKSYGPYGVGGGQHFSIERPGYKIVGFHGRTDHLLSMILIRAIGAYLKPIDHLQNDKCHPSKPLYHIGSSVVPTVRDPSKLLLPPEYPCHPKVITEDNDKANKQISCIISGNQVSGNEGNHNGTYAVANKYKYITYYIGNSNGM